MYRDLDQCTDDTLRNNLAASEHLENGNEIKLSDVYVVSRSDRRVMTRCLKHSCETGRRFLPDSNASEHQEDLPIEGKA